MGFSLGCVPIEPAETGGNNVTIPKTINGTKFDSVIYLNDRVLLFLSSKLNNNQRRMVIDGAIRQISAFEADWGAKTRKVVIYCFDTKLVPCGSRKGKFIGCHYGPSGPIHLAQDKWFTAGPLYHELVHHNLIGGVEHSDPRWETKWYPAQKKIRYEIAMKHWKEMQ
jgi:hypothetical protein